MFVLFDVPNKKYKQIIYSMGFTFGFTQLKRKKKDDGTIPIYLRITIDRKSRYKSAGIDVKPDQFYQPKKSRHKEVRKTCDNYRAINIQLSRMYNKVEQRRLELIKRDEKPTFENILELFEDKKTGNLISYAKEYRKKLKEDDRYWSHRKMGVVINNLERYLGDRNVNLSDVDADFLSDFQRFLLTEGGPEKKDGSREGNSPNTVRRKLQRIKGMFNQAKQSKKIKHDPFDFFEKVKPEEVEKVKLSPKQIDDIKALDLKKGSKLWHTRNYFMYSFYNAGIRFGDLCCLTWSNLIDGRLKYRMNKTNSLKSIKQQQPMIEILNYYKSDDTNPSDYIFPLLESKYEDGDTLRREISSKNVIVNRNLKKLASKAGINVNVSFHIARHSFANYALKKELDLYSISKALGHADLKITEQYLKSFDEEKLDDDMDGIFN